jgi:hypothetical protein
MAAEADSTDPSKVTGREAVIFLSKSNLSRDRLKEIWLMSNKTNASYLTKDEFFFALKLIALDQNGVVVPMNGYDESLINQSETPLPKFEGIEVKSKPSSKPSDTGPSSKKRSVIWKISDKEK